MIALKRTVLGAVLALLSLAACSGGDSSSPTPDQASSSLILTLSNAGVSPKASAVSENTSITVVNSDSGPHQLVSNPDSQQVDCSELNTAVLLPGDTFTATIADGIGTCAFIDSLNPTDSRFQGTITVTSNSGPSGDGNSGG